MNAVLLGHVRSARSHESSVLHRHSKSTASGQAQVYCVCCVQFICVYAAKMAELSSSVAHPFVGQMSKSPSQMSNSQILLDQNIPLGKLVL